MSASKLRSMVRLVVATIGLMSPHSMTKAQLQFSDSLEISLLTCSPGPDAYERFGHTGLRIHDLKSGDDVVFHYGVFSFNAPHFIYRFVKGETDYKMGAVWMDDFVDEYRQRGLGMTEQVLWLDRKQEERLVGQLLENYRPANRTYRYNYFHDNCATRPFEQIAKATQGNIKYDTAWVDHKSHRDIVRRHTGRNTWLDFGIALCIAGEADRPTTFREQMFLPSALERAYDNASVCMPTGATVSDSSLTHVPITLARPLVKEQRTLLKMQSGVRHAIDEHTKLLSPLSVCWAIFMLTLVITIVPLTTKTRKRFWRLCANSLDTVLLLATGVAGVMVWFLNFFSFHPAVDHNWNCLWLLPTNIIFAALIWTKWQTGAKRIYFFITFAAAFVYLVAMAVVAQRPDPAFIPLVWSLAMRAWVNMTRRAV